AAQAFRLDAATDVVEVGLWRNLERQSGAARLLAAFELNHEVAVLGREVGAAVFPLGQDQAGDFREIGDLALDVGGLEGDVAEALGLDHGVLRIVDLIGLELAGSSHGLPDPRTKPSSIAPWLARRICDATAMAQWP